MRKIKLYLLLQALALMLLANLPSENWGIRRLEDTLYQLIPDDVIEISDCVPERQLDALKEFAWFLSGSGWTTNQFLDALFYEMTNGYERGWSALNDREQKIVDTAAWKLSEINLPAVTNFFRVCNEKPEMWCKDVTVCGMLTYTNLEPDVFDYLGRLNVQTNAYDRIALNVYFELLFALRSLNDNLKPAATNRLARYAFGTLPQLIRFQAGQDAELVKLLPAYSNSVQRLEVMRSIAGTATNTYMRTKAAQVVEELSAVPAGGLNNLTWLSDE